MSALLQEPQAPARTTGTAAGTPLLRADGPAEWFRLHLGGDLDGPDGPDEHQDGDQDGDHGHATGVGPSVGPAAPWLRLDDLVAQGGARLADTHRRVLAGEGRGGTAQMAAKWTLSWTAGPVAAAVGLVLGAGGAGVLVDRGTPRLRVHADGWVDRVRLDGCPVAVTPDHPWAGSVGVVVVPDETELVRVTVGSLVTALRPVVDGIRGLARVGARSLWAEVADDLGLALTYRPDLPGRADVVSRLQAAVTAPGAPWRVSPTLRTTAAPWGAEVYVGQKGGCCLAYQRPATDGEEDGTDDLRAFHDRFDQALPDGRHVCNTCSLRDAAGCEERQLFWLGRRR